MTAHVRTRPTWTCKLCHRPWPCREARNALRAEFGANHVALVLHMTGKLSEARADIGDRSMAAVYDQFLSWLDRRALP